MAGVLQSAEANGSPMSEGGRSRGKRRVFPARYDWRRAINLARFGRKRKKRAQFTSRTSCRRVAGKSSELALGTAAGAKTSGQRPDAQERRDRAKHEPSGFAARPVAQATPTRAVSVFRAKRPRREKRDENPQTMAGAFQSALDKCLAHERRRVEASRQPRRQGFPFAYCSKKSETRERRSGSSVTVCTDAGIDLRNVAP